MLNGLVWALNGVWSLKGELSVNKNIPEGRAKPRLFSSMGFPINTGKGIVLKW